MGSEYTMFISQTMRLSFARTFFGGMQIQGGQELSLAKLALMGLLLPRMESMYSKAGRQLFRLGMIVL